jgi:predicted MPP superfamily phosphohydrolase
MGSAAIALGGSAKAFVIDPWSLQIARYRIGVRDLPESLCGLRIAVVADTHLGPRVSEQFIREAVRRTLDLDADVILLAGDYINQRESPADVARLFAPLVDARPNAIAGVLGNHDWYGDAVGIRDALGDLGVRMIDNDRVFIGSDRRFRTTPDVECVCLSGLGDLEKDLLTCAPHYPASRAGCLALSSPTNPTRPRSQS